MPKEHDRRGQTGTSKSAKSAESSRSGHGIVRDEKGQEQPRDKERALHVSRQDKGGDPPGHKEKR
jgi:hypothetical protein